MRKIVFIQAALAAAVFACGGEVGEEPALERAAYDTKICYSPYDKGQGCSCYRDVECASHLSCVPHGDGSYTCELPGGPNDRCNSDADCRSAYECPGSIGATCQLRGVDQRPCPWSCYGPSGNRTPSWYQRHISHSCNRNETKSVTCACKQVCYDQGRTSQPCKTCMGEP